MIKHIRVRRMWQYTHQSVELTLEEQAHVAECKACLSLFKLCVLAESPSKIDFDEQPQRDLSEKKAA